MSSVNMAILVGNLGRDPEMRSTQDGKRIANFSIATSETWKDRNSGERKERTEWHRIVIFNEGLAKVAEQFLKKGSKVYIQGKIQTRSWTDQNNVERYTTEIVLSAYDDVLKMLDGANRGDGGGSRSTGADDDYSGGGGDYNRGSSSSGSGGGRSAYRGSASTKDDLDDEIPFVINDLRYEPYLRKRLVA